MTTLSYSANIRTKEEFNMERVEPPVFPWHLDPV